jgi:hypothetical protein
MATLAERTVNADAAAGIVKNDIVLRKLFSDLPAGISEDADAQGTYSFLSATSKRDIGWVRIKTTSGANHDPDMQTAATTPEFIRMLCVNVYTARESFQIQESLGKDKVIFTDEGHLATWGDDTRYPKPSGLKTGSGEDYANVEMYNPVMSKPDGSGWRKPINTRRKQNNDYYGHKMVIIPSERCVFSKNLKWILYALPNYKYTYVNAQVGEFTNPLTKNEKNEGVINAALDKAVPQQMATENLHGNLPDKYDGESAVYVLLYNPVHRKNFRNFYRTLFYGDGPNYAGQKISDVHEQELYGIDGTSSSAAGTTFNKVMKKYCNAFIVKSVGMSGVNYYSYADPSCAVVFTGIEPSSPFDVGQDTYSRVGNMHHKNYTKNTWRYKWYAQMQGAMSAVYDDSNFMEAVNPNVNPDSHPLFNLVNTVPTVLCWRGSDIKTPSQWLKKAGIVGTSTPEGSDSYLESFYNNAKTEETGTLVNSSASPAAVYNALTCQPSDISNVVCEVNVAADTVSMNNVTIDQHCPGMNPDHVGVSVDSADGTILHYAQPPKGSYGKGIGPVLMFEISFNITTPFSFSDFLLQLDSFSTKMKKAFAIETGLGWKQFDVMLNKDGAFGMIAYVKVYMTKNTYTDLGMTIESANNPTITIDAMSSDKIVNFFTHLVTYSDAKYSTGFTSITTRAHLSVKSSTQVDDLPDFSTKNKKIYIIVIVVAIFLIFLIIAFIYMKYKNII